MRETERDGESDTHMYVKRGRGAEGLRQRGCNETYRDGESETAGRTSLTVGDREGREASKVSDNKQKRSDREIDR